MSACPPTVIRAITTQNLTTGNLDFAPVPMGKVWTGTVLLATDATAPPLQWMAKAGPVVLGMVTPNVPSGPITMNSQEFLTLVPITPLGVTPQFALANIWPDASATFIATESEAAEPSLQAVSSSLIEAQSAAATQSATSADVIYAYTTQVGSDTTQYVSAFWIFVAAGVLLPAYTLKIDTSASGPYWPDGALEVVIGPCRTIIPVASNHIYSVDVPSEIVTNGALMAMFVFHSTTVPPTITIEGLSHRVRRPLYYDPTTVFVATAPLYFSNTGTTPATYSPGPWSTAQKTAYVLLGMNYQVLGAAAGTYLTLDTPNLVASQQNPVAVLSAENPSSLDVDFHEYAALDFPVTGAPLPTGGQPPIFTVPPPATTVGAAVLQGMLFYRLIAS